MAEEEKKPENDGKKMVERNPDGTIKSGVLNPKGKPKGTESFKTKWEAFIEKVAKTNNMTPQQIDEQLFAVGFAKAKAGDYAFYRDLHDRIYGKPQQHVDVTTDGEKITNAHLSPEAIALAEEYEKKLRQSL